MQCISRKHHPYFKDLAAAMQTETGTGDDTVSTGVDNPSYGNGLASPSGSSFSSGASFPASSQLARQSELVRDASVFRHESVEVPRRPRRRPGKTQERPALDRIMSDMSDVSNSTTSTFVSCAPSLRSDAELNEKM